MSLAMVVTDATSSMYATAASLSLCASRHDVWDEGRSSLTRLDPSYPERTAISPSAYFSWQWWRYLPAFVSVAWCTRQDMEELISLQALSFKLKIVTFQARRRHHGCAHAISSCIRLISTSLRACRALQLCPSIVFRCCVHVRVAVVLSARLIWAGVVAFKMLSDGGEARVVRDARVSGGVLVAAGATGRGIPANPFQDPRRAGRT
ncbi:hypothetical protein C2E23DRAFT_341524 [Lenzites betulinus]|nr:hypothetical protein C2E23DRAFT_341524 [Lenzites betulinus]